MMKFLFFSIIVLINASILNAQWNTNTNQNNMLCNAANNQTTTKMIPDGEGGVIIVWEDYRVSTANRDIYAQRIDKYGVKQWGDSNGIPIGITANGERWPDLCSDGRGGAYFVWDYNPSSVITYIKGQRITKSGMKLWSDTGNVIVFSGNRQTIGKIVPDYSGGFFIAYQTSELNSVRLDIKVNRIDSTGNKLWGNGNFICQVESNPSDVTIVNSTDNGFFVSWSDFRTGILTENDIFVQKISSSGTAIWQANGVPICTKMFAQQYPEIFPDANGGVFIAWNDKRDSIQFDVYAQRVRADGSVVGIQNGVPICTDTSSQYRPSMTTDMKGGIYIIWYDYRNGPAYPFDIDIYAQRLDSNCNVKWVTNGINVCNAAFSQINHSVVTDSSFGAVITWDDRRAGQSIYDIYAQRIDTNGNLLWNSDDMPVSIATGNQYRPKIVTVADGYIIMFEDTRNGINNYDLFIQKVNRNGGMPLNIVLKSSENPSGIELKQNYPNPFNPVTKIEFYNPKNDFITVVVYDLLGREINTLLSRRLNPGNYKISFNGSDLPSGVYFYKLTAGNYSDVKKMLLQK